MKIVISSEKEEKRLKPITCTVPQPLLKLCGKPIIEYTLDMLKKHGISECIISTGYASDKIASHFDGEEYKGIKLYFTNDLKAALKDSDEDILFIDGGTMYSFNITSAIKFYKSSRADAVIITKRVSDPREHDMVLCNSTGVVHSFLEKPSYESFISDTASTGMYIMSKKAFDTVGQDISAMLNTGMKIYAFGESGYMCDIKDTGSYLKCQRDILSGVAECEFHGHKTLDGLITCSADDFKGVKISAPCYIGKNVKIAPGCIIDAYSVIGNDVTIEKGSKIHGSVIMNGAFIGERVTCNDAVICSNARLLSGTSVFENAVIGEKAIIGAESIIENGVKIWSEKQLSPNTIASYDIKYGNAKPLYIEDDGICGETNSEITPQICNAVGFGLSSVSGEDNVNFPVAIGYRGTHSSEALALSVISGILSGGTDVWNLGECIETELTYAMSQSGIKLGCFIECGIMTKIKFFGENGLPISRMEERRIEQAVNYSDYSKAGSGEFGKIHDIYSLKELYSNHIRKTIGTNLHGLNVSVSSGNKRVTDVCEKILYTINDKNGTHLIFHISSDGRKLSAYSEETGYIFYDKLLLLGCGYAMEKGFNVALPFSAPKMADNIAEKYGKTIRRYYNCPADKSDSEARITAAETTFPRDAVMLMSLILRSLSERNISISDAVMKLPQFTSVSRFVPVSKSPAEILRCVCMETCGLTEGVIACDTDCRVLIRPVRTGKGVMMFVESFKTETASELCDIYEKKIEENSR